MTKKIHVFKKILTAGLLVSALTVGYEGFHARELNAATSLVAGADTVTEPTCWHCVDANNACNLISSADSVSKGSICYKTASPGYKNVPPAHVNCDGRRGQKPENSKTPTGISSTTGEDEVINRCAPTKRYVCQQSMVQKGVNPDGTPKMVEEKEGTHRIYRWQEVPEEPNSTACGMRSYCEQINTTFEESCKTPPKQ